MIEDIINVIRKISDSELRTMPEDGHLLLGYLDAQGQLPKDVADRMERVFGKKWRD